MILRFRGGGIGAVHVGWTGEGSASVYTLDVLAADATLELRLDPAAVACTPRDALETLTVALAGETAIATGEIVRL